MWRPRLPNQRDPDFWPVAGLMFGLPLVFGLTQGASLVPSALVGLAFVGILWIVRR